MGSTIAFSNLLELAHELAVLVGDTDDRVSIAVETDLDDAFLIGTQAALVRLAAGLLRTAASDDVVRDVAGVRCRWSTHTCEAADPSASIVVGAECVVATDDDRRRLVEHFRVLAGDL